MNFRIAYVTLAAVSVLARLAFCQSAENAAAQPAPTAAPVATPAATALQVPTIDSSAAKTPTSAPNLDLTATLTPTPTPAGPTPTPIDPLKAAQYRALLDQSNDLMSNHKYDESLKAVDQAEKIMGVNAVTLNLRGAVMVKLKKFDEATTLYQQAIKNEPGFFPAEYNLGEVDFEKGQYDKAADYFKKLLDDYPGNELLQFMVFLSYIESKNNAEAEKWLNNIRFPSNSPSWYYAQAVWNIKNGNKNEARDLIRSSAYIFGDKNKFFDETLTQVDLLPIK